MRMEKRPGQFLAHQPDLNISNPVVREEIRKIMGFWLQLGIDGFRVDAAPMLIELPEIEQSSGIGPYVYLHCNSHLLTCADGGMAWPPSAFET